MRHWLLETQAIQTPEIFTGKEPVLLVSNDDDDELWQLIGTADGGPDGRIAQLHHAVDEDPTLVDVLDLNPGQQATRSGVGLPWTRRGTA